MLKCRNVVCFVLLWLVGAGLVLQSLTEYRNGNYYNVLVLFVPWAKMIGMLLMAECLEVEVGQALVWFRYPYLMFISDTFMLSPAFLLMGSSETLQGNQITI